jgi:hypothetical protein
MSVTDPTQLKELLTKYNAKMCSNELRLSKEEWEELKNQILGSTIVSEEKIENRQRVYFKKSPLIVFIEWVLLIPVGYLTAKSDFLKVGLAACIYFFMRSLQKHLVKRWRMD